MLNRFKMEQLRQENEQLQASLNFVCQLNEILLKYRQNLLDLIASCDCGLGKKQERLIGELEKSYNHLIGSNEKGRASDNINQIVVLEIDTEDKQMRGLNDNKAVKRRQSRTSSRQTKKVNYCEEEGVMGVAVKEEKVDDEGEVDGEEDDENDFVVKKTSKSKSVKRNKKNSYDLSKFKVNAEGKILGLDKPKWMRGQAGFYCDYPGCDFFGKKRIDLVEHMAEHTGETSEYVCGQCKRSFNKKTKWLEHNSLTHSFACDIKTCGRSFPTSSKLTQHKIKDHSDKKPYGCDWPGCTYRGKDRYEVKCHHRTHTGERPYKCTHEGCDKSFIFRNSLREHLISHSDRTFKCHWPGCDSAHKRKANLKRHLLQHTGTKEVKCDWPGCEFKCLDNKNLSRHREFVHLMVRKFHCTWPGCEKKFYYNFKLQNHMCTHTGEKPIECSFPGCEKRFILKHNMLTHRALHERTEYRRK